MIVSEKRRRAELSGKQSSHLSDEIDLRSAPVQGSPQLVRDVTDEAQLGQIRLDGALSEHGTDDDGADRGRKLPIDRFL